MCGFLHLENTTLIKKYRNNVLLNNTKKQVESNICDGGLYRFASGSQDKGQHLPGVMIDQAHVGAWQIIAAQFTKTRMGLAIITSAIRTTCPHM
ncbi:hypothetical protein DPMN_187571 [Dreissena polymorpha]|uniref:Uncharacterized protein n=1 Tax=Dreissena polymorpha TaxID=45954 RepID=A0A9D4DRB2_DREPO|nr:hypothetical protein DPMN_187571 [Dreissena polymorpha]